MMTGTSDKRRCQRLARTVDIMHTCGPSHPWCYYGAKMGNRGQGGIYFESRYPVAPGTTILFNEASFSLKSYRPQMYHSKTLLVRWCRPLPKGADGFYGMGAAFAEQAENMAHPMGREPVVVEDAGDLICQSAAQTLEQACRQIEQIKAHAQSTASQLRLLNRFALSISATLDLKAILDTICREMTEIFRARNTGIGILNPDRTSIEVVAFHSADPNESAATGMVMSLEGNAATHRVVETGQAIVVPDVQHNPLTESYQEIARRRGTQCLMIVPLMTRGKVIGTIGMPTAETERIFSPQDVSLAQTIASQIAGAIDNANLFAETQRARDAAEHELAIGRELQKEFFPAKLPEVNGWDLAAVFKPARQVTGDFYDAFLLDQGRWLSLVIADVCDHGVGSALFMVLFRSLIRAFAAQQFTGAANPARALATVIAHVNAYIAGTHEASGMFATVFWAVVEPVCGKVFYVNAGHEPPQVIDATGQARGLKPTGPAVGLDGDLRFDVGQIQMGPASFLFAYTDGATDVQNTDGRAFGKQHLMEIACGPHESARQMLDRLSRAIDRHTGEAVLYDDVTLLAAKRR